MSLDIWKGFKKKSIKLLAKPRTDSKKCLLYSRRLLYDAVTLPKFSAIIIDLPVEKCLLPWILSEWVLVSLLE